MPSGLFRQPEAVNLAGVLFSNSHTASKFNRIGTEQGLAAVGTALTRFGTCYNFAPDATEPDFFAYVVGDRPDEDEETFEEGLHLFVNPWAAVPLSTNALPGVTTYKLGESGVLGFTFPVSFRPFASKTVVFEQEGAEMLARYLQLKLLGRLPPDAPELFDTEEPTPNL
ncbi:Glycosaminoglycan attachment site [Alloactinosynnema sp. L-07]|nr:Glycosaminoglycan attachment site [Alloactinosynnema sp. L-07]